MKTDRAHLIGASEVSSMHAVLTPIFIVFLAVNTSLNAVCGDIAFAKNSTSTVLVFLHSQGTIWTWMFLRLSSDMQNSIDISISIFRKHSRETTQSSYKPLYLARCPTIWQYVGQHQW